MVDLINDESTPTVVLPEMCSVHQSYLVHTVMRFTQHDPWIAATVVAQLLCFQAATADSRLHQRTGGRTEDMSLVLAELGPLCCAIRESVLGRVWEVMGKGLDHASGVSRRVVTDPDFDIPQMSNTLRKKVLRGGVHG